LFRFDEGRSATGNHPDFSIGRLFTNQWRNHPGKAPQFNLQDEKRGFVRCANDGKFVLALGYD
jgi:hypothetical protein